MELSVDELTAYRVQSEAWRENDENNELLNQMFQEAKSRAEFNAEQTRDLVERF